MNYCADYSGNEAKTENQHESSFQSDSFETVSIRSDYFIHPIENSGETSSKFWTRYDQSRFILG